MERRRRSERILTLQSTPHLLIDIESASFALELALSLISFCAPLVSLVLSLGSSVLAPVLLLALIPLVSGAPDIKSVAAKLAQHRPAISFAEAVALAQQLLANVDVMRLADEQWADQYGRRANAILSFVGGVTFRREDALNFGARRGAVPACANDRETKLLLDVAEALGISRAGRCDDEPELHVGKTICRIITSRARRCTRCGSSLQKRRDAKAVWLLFPARVEAGACLHVLCRNRHCGADHEPDSVVFKAGGHRLRAYDLEASFLKVGQRMYAHQDLAKLYTALLETRAMPTSTFAVVYRSLYAPNAEWSLGSDQVWKTFVVHEALTSAAEQELGFTAFANSSVSHLVQLALSGLMASKRIPGAMDHSCPECCRFKRTWRDGPMPGEGEEVPSLKKSERVCCFPRASFCGAKLPKAQGGRQHRPDAADPHGGPGWDRERTSGASASLTPQSQRSEAVHLALCVHRVRE